MRLNAGEAARRFAGKRARKETLRQPPRWFSLSLRWRKGTRPAPANVVRPVRPAISQSFLSQFHLHLSLRERIADERSRRHLRGMAVTEIMWRQTREAPARAPALISRGRLSSVEHSHRIAHRQSTTRQSVVRNIHSLFTSVAPQSLRRAKQRIAASRRDTKPSDLQALARRHDGHPGTASTFPMRAQMRPVQLAFAVTGRGLRRELPNEAAEPMSRHFSTIAARPADLVWRKAEARNAQTNAEVPAESLTRTFAIGGRGASGNSPSQAQMQVQMGAAARPMPFDSSMMDRLAEDVIRRVDKRVRIERERRGI